MSPQTVGDYRGNQPTTVSVKYVRREWPYGVVVVDGVEMTPNQARRLVRLLEKAIGRAEERLR